MTCDVGPEEVAMRLSCGGYNYCTKLVPLKDSETDLAVVREFQDERVYHTMEKW